MLALRQQTQAQTVAVADFTDTPLGGGLFDYTVTLQNTGSTPIETFWFAWAPGEDFMAVTPTSIVSPTNWTSTVTHGGSSDGYAIQWKTSTAPLAENATLTYTFESTVTPAAMAADSVFYPTTPVGTSFVYSGQPFSGTSEQFVVAAVPEPAGTGLLMAGAGAILSLRRNRVRRGCVQRER